MHFHILQLYNNCLLTYFHIKISARIRQAENVFSISTVIFWVSLSIPMVFLILALYYACNMPEIVGST